MINGYYSKSELDMYTSSDLTFQVAFDADGDFDQDILLRSTSTGTWYLYEIEYVPGTGLTVSLTNPAIWLTSDLEVRGAGDFDNDGDEDLLARLTTTGEYQIFSFRRVR